MRRAGTFFAEPWMAHFRLSATDEASSPWLLRQSSPARRMHPALRRQPMLHRLWTTRIAMRTPFYPVSLNLVGRKCVVIGASDDREAIDKAAALGESGADVHWITDVGGLKDSDVVDSFFVISTPQDAAFVGSAS